MEKQVLMPMDEYNQLLKLKEDYEILLKELENKENIILIDRRFDQNPRTVEWIDFLVPKITCGEKLVKDSLKEQFDRLFTELQAAKEKLIEKNNKIVELNERLNKKWRK